MKLTEDIIQEMKTIFKSDFDTAYKLLNQYLTENEYLNTTQIIRSIIFLSQNGIGSFKKYLECAKTDPRDVILWAEYEPNEVRIRDFTKAFKQ
jgi:hypothetical protein